MIPVIPIAPLVLVAAVLAPDRGPSMEPLMHARGWNRVVFADGYVTDWADSEDFAATLNPGDMIEVGWGGRCWLDGGTVHAAQLLRHDWCMR